MEDDLDALECVGTNTVPWFGPGMPLRSGDLQNRAADVPPFGPPPVGLSSYEIDNDAPVFFSVTRSSVGEPGSAVRSQFVVDGGAACDVFVTVKNPADLAGDGFNLLFIDEAEIGLYAEDLTPMGAGPMDSCDDLDGLILWVCPEYRDDVSVAIDMLMDAAAAGAPLWSPVGFGDANTGPGMTFSITKMLGVPDDCVRVGFSVSTDSIGLEYTAVDWEAGPVDDPVAGFSTAAGDLFFVDVTGAGFNPNYLWYEGSDLGLDEGAWVCGTSTELGELSDNVNALDSIDDPVPAPMISYCTSGTSTNGCNALIAGVGTPSASAASAFSLVVSSTEGLRQGLIFYGLSGRAAAPWGTGSSYLCVKSPSQRSESQATGGSDGACDGYLGLDWNAYVATYPSALGVPFSAGDVVQAQGWYRDPPAPKTTGLSNAIEFTLAP